MEYALDKASFTKSIFDSKWMKKSKSKHSFSFLEYPPLTFFMDLPMANNEFPNKLRWLRTIKKSHVIPKQPYMIPRSRNRLMWPHFFIVQFKAIY